MSTWSKLKIKIYCAKCQAEQDVTLKKFKFSKMLKQFYSTIYLISTIRYFFTFRRLI